MLDTCKVHTKIMLANLQATRHGRNLQNPLYMVQQ